MPVYPFSDSIQEDGEGLRHLLDEATQIVSSTGATCRPLHLQSGYWVLSCYDIDVVIVKEQV